MISYQRSTIVKFLLSAACIFCLTGQKTFAVDQIQRQTGDAQKDIDSTNKQSADAPLTLPGGIGQTVIAKPFTLTGAVEYAEQNYPTLLKSRAQMLAAQQNITVQKLDEYLPDSLLQYQEIMASHNKLTEVFYGSPVFPAVTGPGYNNVSMEPAFFSGGGFSIDWAPIDFGLHKARIDLTKSQYDQARTQFTLTRFDVSIAVANSFLDVVESIEQIEAAEANVSSFSEFESVVAAQVKSNLKPGADASLAQAQLANANNQLLRARLTKELALANLANAIGLGGKDVDIDASGIASQVQPVQFQTATPIFDDVPLLKTAKAALASAQAQRKVLNKEYFPVFHMIGGMQLRSSGLALNARDRQSQGASGIFPVVPNYQAALIINWNFLDYFRIKAEKRVQDQRIIAQQQNYNQILQNLQTEDVRARAKVRTAIQLAANMPIQVEAAEMAVRQAQARYRTGLGSVAHVAQANQMLAQSRMQQAIAQVGIWRALLSVAAVHGDLTPFLSEAQRLQKRGT